ncbi:MAG: prolyl oligopeptidase family serine peptidase [Marinilabiliaceae bacterium]|jgi:dipeptidyl aminopeptidase/acylaminoacyl peptidase|nr:prolyl oligopeptidase family serine peptidase [Marinilabiliaceae bacterium]
MKKFLFLIVIAVISFSAYGQDGLKYQKPPKEIVDIMTVSSTPSTSISPDRQMIALTRSPGMPTIEDMSGEMLRLGGMRIDPATNGSSNPRYSVSLEFMDTKGSEPFEVKGLPSKLKLGSFSWADDSKHFAFVNYTSSSIELWMGDIESRTVKKIDDNLNGLMGSFNWLPDNSLLYRKVDPDRGARPLPSAIPEGPVTQENTGRMGAAPTFQDLIKSPEDENIFDYFTRSVITIWKEGNARQIGEASFYSNVNFSPDGSYILVTEVVKPFSYIVPYYYFPSKVSIWDKNGKPVKTVAELPLKENLPRGDDMTFPDPSGFSWRADKPASLYWVKPLDGGDINVEMEKHDQVYMLEAPFTGEPQEYIATEMRFGGITWGNDDLALLSERSRKERIGRQYFFDPDNPEGTMRLIFELSNDDRYADPGRFMSEDNDYGRRVLMMGNKGRSLYLTGQGASPEGDRPFLDEYSIKDGKIKRLWQSEAPYYESVTDILDKDKGLVLTRRETVDVPGNYFIRNLKKGTLEAITDFKNPYPMLEGVTKEKIEYKRNDGLDLSFDLYLPAGYDKEKDGPLPAILWAYPREFKSARAAAQVSGSPYRFIGVSPSSILVMVTQGYAIMDNAAFPIVGEGDVEPNDSFREQLIANAKAAIDKGAELGVVDPERVGVGGHSYGAFMTANLLAHSRLFAAGVARSGAYNRTLTPFGFQNEDRTYWEAPELYNYMAPWMHADKVKDPILLIHGMADNNSGTFPIQSERYYAALKGHGATVRLVLLPKESHGYSASESLMHMQWETLKWFDKYVKNKK